MAQPTKPTQKTAPPAAPRPAPRPEPAERASGTPSHPISTGEAQAGDMNEAASARGGPVDIAPTRNHPARDDAES